MKYAHENLIEKGFGAFSRPYLLVHVPECDEIAGSGMRHVNECYRLVYQIQGVRHSRAYKTLDEAKTEFLRVTTPIYAVE